MAGLPNSSSFESLPLQVHLNRSPRSEKAPHVTGSRRTKRLHYSRRSAPMQGVAAPATRVRDGVFSRRVIVKARVVRMSAYGQKAAQLHLRYLDRDGTAENEERNQFFDHKQDAIERESLQAVREGEPHQFRLIISPEDASRLDMTQFTRDVMSQMESDLRRKLDWVGINHYNTDNPHTHVVIHGLDRTGQTLFIDREYIANGIRHRAMDIATRTLGVRMEHEIVQSLQKDQLRERVTPTDKALLRHADAQHTLDLLQLPDNATGRLQRVQFTGRLQVLARLGYAEHLKGSQWHIAPDVLDKLKQLDHYHVATQRLKQAEQALERPARRYEVHSHTQPIAVSGVILDKGYSDELSERGYLVVAAKDGVLHDVPVEQLATHDYRVGQVVSFTPKQDNGVKPADRNITAFAQQHGGFYDVLAHTHEALQQNKIRVAQSAQFEQAHRKRLRTLVQHRLVAKPVVRQGVEQWQIPDNLPERINHSIKHNAPHAYRAYRTQLEHQLPVKQQTNYAGPTWLDQQYFALQDTARTDGVSQQLKQAAQARGAWLHAQGLEPGVQATRSALREKERQQLAKQLSQQTGLQAKSLAKGERWSGRVMEVVTTLSQRHFVAVRNDQRRQFALVPIREGQTLQRDQQLSIGINPQGRVWMRSLQRGLQR